MNGGLNLVYFLSSRRVKLRLTVRANAIWTIIGSVCCVPAKKRTHPNRTEGETLCRNAIRSPSWNFQWDNRQRVSSEIGTPYQVSRGISTNDSMELKGALSSERGNFSDLGSPLENFGTPISQKSPVHGGTGTNLSPSPDISIARNYSPDTCYTGFYALLSDALALYPLSLDCVELFPIAFQVGLLMAGLYVPFLSSWPILKGKNGLLTVRTLVLSMVGSSSRFSCSPSIDLQSCGVCSKLLTERSSWSIQKIIAGSDTSAVSVLVCGHLYHAECLETMTLEVDKYDPACPICMVGEKQVLKMSRKALRAKAELKAKNLKISKNRVVDSYFDDDYSVFDHQKNADRKGKVSKMEPSSSTRNNSAKPFLKRHFLLGSRWSRSLS
ncbi:hypothetical protein C1H46_042410 [Malus baccata]|uniref:RING-type domain-containing protein n=1 Tax=Malus baccata TaxID=106549 RepID=A0A540KDL7_MALBA|nr:hypothetical protein C1H46_042410 [Malus baccata]